MRLRRQLSYTLDKAVVNHAYHQVRLRRLTIALHLYLHSILSREAVVRLTALVRFLRRITKLKEDYSELYDEQGLLQVLVIFKAVNYRSLPLLALDLVKEISCNVKNCSSDSAAANKSP